MARILTDPSSSGLGGLIHSNPIITRLSKIMEQDDQNSCTYAGIGRKLLFFVAMVVVGILINAILKFGGTALGGIELEELAPGVTVSGTEMLLLAITGLIFLIVPFVSFLIRKTIPVTGALYCAATGYLLSWLGATFGREYTGPILLSLVITVVLVLAMGYVYFTGAVSMENAKVRKAITIIFITMVVTSLLVLVASLIPFTRPFVAAITANPVISIGGGILMVILGCLFLLVDFDTIRRSVDNRLPKEYEWYAAYGLIFSVIWVYFKILQIVLRMTQKKN